MEIGLDDVDSLARGCAVLGTGGGGEVTTGIFIVRQALAAHGPINVVDLAELPAEGLVMSVGIIGAPSVSIEKLGSGTEIDTLRTAVESTTGQRVVGLMASEIGGSNGLIPVAWAAKTGLPLVDADAIGRAFPEIDMVSMNVAGIPPGLMVIADERQNVVTVNPVDGAWAELIARAVCDVFGGSAALADYVIPAGRLAGAVVEATVTMALRIGRAVEAADDPVLGLCGALDALPLITGKIVDVERRTSGGFVRGSVVVEGYGQDSGRLIRIEIQNENLVAIEDGRILASVPDLITLVDSHTADAVATELLRYGQRVAVVAFPCAPLWRTDRGLEIAGPRAFGYDFDFAPVEELRVHSA